MLWKIDTENDIILDVKFNPWHENTIFISSMGKEIFEVLKETGKILQKMDLVTYKLENTSLPLPPLPASDFEIFLVVILFHNPIMIPVAARECSYAGSPEQWGSCRRFFERQKCLLGYLKIIFCMRWTGL